MTDYNVRTTMPTADHTKAALWKKTVKDVAVDGKDYARDIGTVRNGYSRLNVITSLSAGDKDDWFTFNVVSRGNLRFSIKSYSQDTQSSDQENDLSNVNAALDEAQEEADSLRAKNMKVEIYTQDRRGQLKLYATNDESNKTANANFEELINGTAKIQKSTRMYVKLSRLDSAKDLKSTENYTIQVQMGDNYRHDYVTIETAQKEEDYLSDAEAAVEKATTTYTKAGVLAGQGAASMLISGATNWNNIRYSKSSAGKLFSLLI